MAHDNFIDKRRRKLNLRDVHIENVLPEHFASSYPKFITLLEKYYEWQNQYDATELLNHLFLARDITETDITLLNFIEDELLLGGSYFEGSGDKRAAANFSSVLFRAKGSKYSIEWFFRSFFDIDPEVIYTKENIFLIADDNNPLSLISKIGPSSLRFLTNDKLYQTFAILVRAGIPVNQWKNLFKLFVHPAGMYLGGEVLLESNADLNLTSQSSGETTSLNSPVITLTPSYEPVPEGLTVNYVVGAGTSLNGLGATEQTYLYPGTYKWYLEHVTTVDSDFVTIPPQLVTATPSIQAGNPATEGDITLTLNSVSADWIGYDITGLGIYRGSTIINVIGAPTNQITLSNPITQDLPALTEFEVLGGWQDLEVGVQTELPIADPVNSGPGNVPGKVYDTPTSGSFSFTIANDFFLNAEGLEQYNIIIRDWCNAPYRKLIYNVEYNIADVHYIVQTSSVNETGTAQTITINGNNLPDGDINYYLADATTAVGSSETVDPSLTAHPGTDQNGFTVLGTPVGGIGFGDGYGDWDASQPNVFGFNQRQTITVSGNTASFDVYPRKDFITDSGGGQTFRVFLTGPATYSDYHADPNNVELLAYLNPSNTQEQGAIVTINDTSVYPQYSVSVPDIVEGSTISPTVTVTNEHNPNGDFFYNQTTETLTSDGVLCEISDDAQGRINVTSIRRGFDAASNNFAASLTSEDGYYRGPQTLTYTVTNHDVPAQVATDTFVLSDAAPANSVISGPDTVVENTSNSWTFTYQNAPPGTNYYWEVVGADDADFSPNPPPRTGSRSTLTVDSTANSVTAGGNTMIMTSTIDLTIAYDAIVPEVDEPFTISIFDAPTGGTLIDSFDVTITDVVPVYTVTSNTPVTEGNDIVLSLAVTNPVPEDVGVTITDDGSGRYSTTVADFTSTGYADITIPTTLNAALQGAQNLTVTVTGNTSGQTDSTTVVLNDVTPVYEVITSQASYVEGDTVVVGLNFTNGVGEDVDLAISDDGTGRYSTAGDTFIWNGSSYANLNITTSIDAAINNSQTITLTVTGQSSGVQDTVTFDLTDAVPVYTVSVPNTVEGDDIVITIGNTGVNVGETVNVTITDDGTGRYDTVGPYSVTNTGTVTIPTTLLSSTDANNPITVTATGASSGVSANDTFDLTDVLPSYTISFLNTSNTPITTIQEGGTIRLSLGVTNSNGEQVSWAITGDSQGRLASSSGDFTTPYNSQDVVINVDTGFVGPEVFTITVTGDDSGATAQDTITVTEAAAVRTNVINMVATTVTEGDSYSFDITQTLQNTATYADFDYEITGDTRANVALTTITAAAFAGGSGTVTINPTTTSDNLYQGPQTITISGTGTSDTFSLEDEAQQITGITGPTTINDGGTAPTIAIDPTLVSTLEANASGGTCNAEFTIKSDGDFTTAGSPSLGHNASPSVSADNWVVNASQGAGFGDDYQVQVLSYDSTSYTFGDGTLDNSVDFTLSVPSSNNVGSATWSNNTSHWYRLNSDFFMRLTSPTVNPGSVGGSRRMIDITIKEFDGTTYGTGTTVLEHRFQLSADLDAS